MGFIGPTYRCGQPHRGGDPIRLRNSGTSTGPRRLRTRKSQPELSSISVVLTSEVAARRLSQQSARPQPNANAWWGLRPIIARRLVGLEDPVDVRVAKAFLVVAEANASAPCSRVSRSAVDAVLLSH
ncbi:MAG: hypothetical protein GY788_31170 [bacterium]|nr:hypothetical protein [bacterium]